MSALGLLDVGPMEMLVLGVAAIMLFGGDLPDIARRAGGIVGRLRAAAHELTRQIDPPADLLHLPDPDAEARRLAQARAAAATPAVATSASAQQQLPFTSPSDAPAAPSISPSSRSPLPPPDEAPPSPS